MTCRWISKAGGLVESARGDTKDLVQIVFHAIDHELWPAATIEDARDYSVRDGVLATHTHGLADERQRQVVRQRLVARPE